MWELARKAESQRIDAFELWCWKRLLRVLWTARRSNQSLLKEISPEYSLEGLILKLKLQYFVHLMRRTDSLEKTLMLGKIEGRRRRGRQRVRWLSLTQWTWVWASSRSWWWTKKPGMLQSMGSQRVRHDWATELDWTETLLPSSLPVLSHPIHRLKRPCSHLHCDHPLLAQCPLYFLTNPWDLVLSSVSLKKIPV